MHFTHIKLKPTKRFQTDFNISELFQNADIPKESKEIAQKHIKSKEILKGYDLMIAFENSIIFGFEHLNKNERLIIPELNPTTIFYSNAVMSHRNLILAREELFHKSPTYKNYQKPINPKLFGTFFQLSSNCIINLQSALESFANRQIPENHTFLDKNNEEFEPSLFHKIDKALPDIHNRRFKSKFKKDNIIIRKLIELRNEIIHLEPIKETTNTRYKTVYRKLLNFEYTKAIISVRNFINFYEPDLIEECSCNKEYYYDFKIKDKE